MTRNTDIRVPDGYFRELEETLLSIQERQSSRKIHLAPYFAYAASLAAVALAGTFILRKTAVKPEEESSAEWSYVSYLAQSLDPDGATYHWGEDTLTDDELATYLADDGLTLEELAGYEENY